MKVGLFIPCYINAVYPQVGVASFKVTILFSALTRMFPKPTFAP